MTRVAIYQGEAYLGELDVVPVGWENFQFPSNEIRLHHISPSSDRCHPLSVLRTISTSVRCKLEPSSKLTADQFQLINLHASCFHELKTAVVIVGNEEVHLVAMPSKLMKFPCFWCYSVPIGVYHGSLAMLNLRCLAIVFDLDETLVVSNTMKSFEDKIGNLRGRIARESDPIRASGMTAEMNRYIEDRSLLMQYADKDSVVDGGKSYQAKPEEARRLSDTQQRGFLPVIRLEEKNIVLTRINPEIRDTSVLVRLRPGWEDLKTYLTAKDRKRFEVHVCTMAKREYALEMWRLLDPEARLISLNQLKDRIVSVKAGARKSLLTVFRQGNCHPNIAMVIDDRLQVWEARDQPRVHVVPAFTPYFAPQAEIANAVPVLCVARNVACNVRGGFFKEFDDSLLHRIHYEDVSLPAAPDVTNYLNGSEAAQRPNNSQPQPDVEVVAKLPIKSSAKEAILAEDAPDKGSSGFVQESDPLKLANNIGFSRSQNQSSANVNEQQPEGATTHIPSFSLYALYEIGRKCSSKVEFRPVRTSDDLEFAAEAFFAGEKVGVGRGKTPEEAQLQAADKALRALAHTLDHT